MPEGHTIHRLALDHARYFTGTRPSALSPQGRFNPKPIDQALFLGAEAYGKHLFYHFESNTRVHIHLGLFGKFRHAKIPMRPPRGAVRLRMFNAQHGIDLSGPTACEVISEKSFQELLARIGPDVLRDDADPERAWQKISKSKRSIGALLMDQSVLAGVGNVYRAEVLFIHGLHPEYPGHRIDKKVFFAIWSSLTSLMREGVRQKKIITVTDAKKTSQGSKKRLTRNERVFIYRKSYCPRCHAPIRRWLLAGRWAYACETCQPLR